MSPRAVPIAALVTLAVGILGATAGSARDQALSPVTERTLAADFELRDAEGRTHRLSDYRGKVVLVNFWATWCPPCLREIPSMQRLSRKLADVDFVILAVDVGEDEDTVFGFTFALDEPIEFPMLLDRDGAVVQQWSVLGLPTSFIVDPQGRVAYRAVGGREWDAPPLVARIRALVE